MSSMRVIAKLDVPNVSKEKKKQMEGKRREERESKGKERAEGRKEPRERESKKDEKANVKIEPRLRKRAQVNKEPRKGKYWEKKKL